MSKTILIPGASSGFGRATAETPFRAGHTVYASMRRAQGKNREAAEAVGSSASRPWNWTLATTHRTATCGRRAGRQRGG